MSRRSPRAPSAPTRKLSENNSRLTRSSARKPESEESSVSDRAIDRRTALRYSALCVGLGVFTTTPPSFAEETTAEDTVAAEGYVGLEPAPVVEIPPEVTMGWTDDGEKEQTDKESEEESTETITVGDVTLTRYVDVNSGYSISVPNDWSRDQPMANTPEFHPKSEYGGRRFRIEVMPVGKVPGGGQKLQSLVNSEMESLTGAGFESPLNFAQVEATKFAPVKGTPAADVAAKGPGGAVTEILQSEKSENGDYYMYEYRTDGVYPIRFFGVAAIGPGQVGGARKLKRRDLVKVTCQVPEKDATESDYELLRAISKSFKVDECD